MSNSHNFTPACSVVICTRNRPDALNRCLKAVAALDYPHFDVLVVDNAPSDDRARAVAERWRASYIVEPVAGLSRARNLGARSCSGEVIAYTDDDAVPEQGFGHERRVFDRATPFWFEMANFGGIGDGDNMAFRRQALAGSLAFDERLGRGACLPAGEEHYAFYELIERGWRVAYTPDAVVRHPQPETFSGLSEQRLKIMTEGAAYAALLFAEHPSYRGKLMRYAARSLNGGQPWQQRHIDGKRLQVFPRWHKLVASFVGTWRYVRSVRLRVY